MPKGRSAGPALQPRFPATAFRRILRMNERGLEGRYEVLFLSNRY
jgi:hypothetical protein